MEIKIKKGIVMPKGPGEKTGMSKKFRDLIAKMDIGDSFEFELKHYVLLRSIYNPIHNDPADHRHFATRKLSADKRGCWRIE